jgi:arsenate reductase
MVIKVACLYWLPHCSTCQKALAWLEAQNIEVLAYHDVKLTSVSQETLNTLIEGIGSVDALFSKRAMKYRAWGLHERVLTDQDKHRYMLEEYTFIKRPVLLLDNGKVLAGFSEKQWLAALKP